jgi:hypothetical protein
VHPHTHRDRTAERDTDTIANQKALIRKVERRVRSQHHRIAELETLVGYEQVALSPRSSALGRH